MNLVDFAFLAGYWGLSDCGGADIDGSGDIGLADLSDIAASWLGN